MLQLVKQLIKISTQLGVLKLTIDNKLTDIWYDLCANHQQDTETFKYIVNNWNKQ